MSNEELQNEIMKLTIPQKRCEIMEYDEIPKNTIAIKEIPYEIYHECLPEINIIKTQIIRCNTMILTRHHWNLIARITSIPSEMAPTPDETFYLSFSKLRKAFKGVNDQYALHMRTTHNLYLDGCLRFFQTVTDGAMATLFHKWDEYPTTIDNMSIFKAIHDDIIKFRDRNFLEEHLRILKMSNPTLEGEKDE
jgi:hypothetical protein